MNASELKAVEGIERLDLTHLDKPPDNVKSRVRKKSSVSNTNISSGKPSNDQTDLYDGDDDDSDNTTANEHVNLRKSSDTLHKQIKTSSLSKSPVIIPSSNHPPDTEILLAVKLPTDSTRHQRYFKCHETLQSVIDFAEELAGQDFGGYILVCSAPKIVYSDLELTIEEAGLEDKTVLHLEEGD